MGNNFVTVNWSTCDEAGVMEHIDGTTHHFMATPPLQVMSTVYR
jgi:hypothetical protein